MRKILILLFMFSCFLSGEEYDVEYEFVVVNSSIPEAKGMVFVMQDMIEHYEGKYSDNATLFIGTGTGQGGATLELEPGVTPVIMKGLASEGILFFVLNSRYWYYKNLPNDNDYPRYIFLVKKSESIYFLILTHKHADRQDTILQLKFVKKRAIGE